MLPAAALTTLLACSDQSLIGPKGEGDAVDDGESVDTEPTEDTDVPCEVASVPAEATEAVRACPVATAGAEDPWEMELLWEDSASYTPGGCLWHVIADLNQDGVIDVLCSSFFDEGHVAWDAETGAEAWRWYTFADEAPASVGDIRSDGTFAIVGYGADAALVALAADGSEIWRTSEAMTGGTRSWVGLWARPPRFADLDQDGDIEVITHRGIVDGATGAVEHTLDGGGDLDLLPYADLSIADIDRDGDLEVLAGFRAWEDDGSLIWQAVEADELDLDIVPLLVQADADPGAEIAWVGTRAVRLVDTDGTEIWSVPGAGNHVSTIACASDADGDGLSEVYTQVMDDGIGAFIVSLGMDGVERWRIPRVARDDDPIIQMMCTVFDFDGDGREEVIAMTDFAVYVLDALDGTTLITLPGDRTRGQVQIVDVDGDGSADLVMNSIGQEAEGSGEGIQVYSNPSHAWMPAPPIWSTSNWSGVDVYPNGEIPLVPDAPWLTTGIQRGQPAGYEWGSDLSVEIVDECVSSCDPSVATSALSIRVVNLGPQSARAPIPVLVYDAAGTLVETLSFDEDTPVGTASSSQEIRVGLTTAEDGLRFVAGDGSVHDCDPSNDEVTWRTEACSER